MAGLFGRSGIGRKIEPQDQPHRDVEGDNDRHADHQAIHDDPQARRNWFADTMQTRGFFGDPAKWAKYLIWLVRKQDSNL